MRKYELTYLISDEVSEADLNKVTGKVSGFIVAMKGKIEKEEVWGRRKLAYQIKKQDFATYVTLYFSLPADKVKEFDQELRLTTQVVRHLLLVKEYDSEKITLTADEIANTSDIEEVIGGESAEVVEIEPVVETKEEEKTEEVEEVAVEETVEAPLVETVEEEKIEKIVKEPKEVKEEKVEAPKKAKKKEVSDEAERLSKLNEELDDILKDEL